MKLYVTFIVLGYLCETSDISGINRNRVFDIAQRTKNTNMCRQTRGPHKRPIPTVGGPDFHRVLAQNWALAERRLCSSHGQRCCTSLLWRILVGQSSKAWNKQPRRHLTRAQNWNLSESAYVRKYATIQLALLCDTATDSRVLRK